MATLFINLTQHALTPEQDQWVAENCYALVEDEQVKTLLNFSELPTKEELERRADYIVSQLGGNNPDFYKMALIGGAPFFMSVLEHKLKEAGIQPVYAFSKRVSVEGVNEHGEVVKTSVFKHEGWIEV